MKKKMHMLGLCGHFWSYVSQHRTVAALFETLVYETMTNA